MPTVAPLIILVDVCGCQSSVGLACLQRIRYSKETAQLLLFDSLVFTRLLARNNATFRNVIDKIISSDKDAYSSTFSREEIKTIKRDGCFW